MSTIRDVYNNIASAIRFCNGTSETYTPAQMPDAILNIIPSGFKLAYLSNISDIGTNLTVTVYPSTDIYSAKTLTASQILAGAQTPSSKVIASSPTVPLFTNMKLNTTVVLDYNKFYHFALFRFTTACSYDYAASVIMDNAKIIYDNRNDIDFDYTTFISNRVNLVDGVSNYNLQEFFELYPYVDISHGLTLEKTLYSGNSTTSTKYVLSGTSKGFYFKSYFSIFISVSRPRFSISYDSISHYIAFTHTYCRGSISARYPYMTGTNNSTNATVISAGKKFSEIVSIKSTAKLSFNAGWTANQIWFVILEE